MTGRVVRSASAWMAAMGSGTGRVGGGAGRGASVARAIILGALPCPCGRGVRAGGARGEHRRTGDERELRHARGLVVGVNANIV